MAINARAGRLGEIGEEIAAQFLIKKGYRILDRNWRIKEGEIDIVALSPESDIIFIEVKSRTSAAFGDPLESITIDKAMRIQRLALAWLATHQRLGSNFRIDAIGILMGRTGAAAIDHRTSVL